MKAAVMYGVGDLRLEEVPVPVIGDDEILLKVRAASVCGTDIRILDNGRNDISEKSPRILGHEIAGDIVKTGKNVKSFEEGMRVTVAPNTGCGLCRNCISGKSHLCPTYKALGINSDGGFAEYCVIPAVAVRSGNVMPLPENVTYEEAALNEPLSCVFNGFERCDIRPGDNVLLIGAGPIGIMHATLAQLAGAGRIFVHDLSEERVNAACEYVKNTVPVRGDLQKFIAENTDDGVDVCIVACPSVQAQAQALTLCTYGGRILFFGGVPQSKLPVGIDSNIIHYKELTVSGTTRASLLQFTKTLDFIAKGIVNVKALVSATYPLEKIHEAFEATRTARGLKNVIVFE